MEMTSAQKHAARAKNIKKLPEQAYVDALGEDVICIVKRGESGYYRTDWPFGKRDRQAFVDEMNKRLNVTPEQASAMFHGSLMGWHTPAADPEHGVNGAKTRLAQAEAKRSRR